MYYVRFCFSFQPRWFPFRFLIMVRLLYGFRAAYRTFAIIKTSHCYCVFSQHREYGGIDDVGVLYCNSTLDELMAPSNGCQALWQYGEEQNEKCFRAC